MKNQQDHRLTLYKDYGTAIPLTALTKTLSENNMTNTRSEKETIIPDPLDLKQQ